MLAIPIDPALLLSSPLRPAQGQPALDALLAPGEAVQATVLDAQDDGSLLILVKGIAVPAASLVGRLPVGAVLEAHVESREGQILLRLDQPVQPAQVSAQPAGLPPSGHDVESTAGPLRIAALLKTLLPADEPLAAGLTRLAGSLSEAAARGQVSAEAVAEFEGLHKQVLLEGRPEGQPLSGARVQEALRSLGLEHEHRLLTTWQETGMVGDQAARPTLKGWLMAMLAKTAPPSPSAGASAATIAPRPTSAEPPVPQAVRQGQGQGQGSGQGRWIDVKPTSPGGVNPGGIVVGGSVAGKQPASPDQAGGGSATGGQEDPQAAGPGRGSGPSSWERPAVRTDAPVASPSADMNETDGARRAIPKEPPSGPAQAEDQATKEGGRTPGALSRQASHGGPVEGERMPMAPARLASPSPTPALGPSPAGIRLAGSIGASDSAGAQGTLPSSQPAGASGSEGSGWVKDLQQVLTILERTQALSSLNSQSGQPILFELPLAWGGQARVQFYVESRESGGQGTPRQPRSYSVVTLLELDGIGGVRVDTLVTGWQISARFLMDQPDVERAVATMLPALTRSLSAKGYQVDLIASGTGDSRQVRGEDLRARSTPRLSLLNVRA